jgi:hypothetical protein
MNDLLRNRVEHVAYRAPGLMKVLVGVLSAATRVPTAAYAGDADPEQPPQLRRVVNFNPTPGGAHAS